MAVISPRLACGSQGLSASCSATATATGTTTERIGQPRCLVPNASPTWIHPELRVFNQLRHQESSRIPTPIAPDPYLHRTGPLTPPSRPPTPIVPDPSPIALQAAGHGRADGHDNPMARHPIVPRAAPHAAGPARALVGVPRDSPIGRPMHIKEGRTPSSSASHPGAPNAAGRDAEPAHATPGTPTPASYRAAWVDSREHQGKKRKGTHQWLLGKPSVARGRGVW